jgi:radical SAM protein with 4Fe4S-binding SPASM domain
VECQKARNSCDLFDAYAKVDLCLPKALTLAITNRCNLHCAHCWPDSQQSGCDRPVPTRTVLRLIKEFVEIGGDKVCITGGEPLTHPDWFQILAYCCEQPSVEEVCLQTNGTLLLGKEADLLASLDTARLTVQVSLDGATPEIHNRVRGADSFERTIRSLYLLTEKGFGERIRVAFTEMGHNFGEIIKLLEFADTLGIGSVVSGTLVRGGRALRSDWLDQPSSRQYLELLQCYHTDERTMSLYNNIGNIAALEWYLGRRSACEESCCFVRSPYVKADGRMYPCTMLQIDEFAPSRVFERSFAEVLREGLPLWTELMTVRQRRSSKLKECEGCEGRLHCAGGCMGRAHAAYGDLIAPEDRCSLRRAVYAWRCTNLSLE